MKIKLVPIMVVLCTILLFFTACGRGDREDTLVENGEAATASGNGGVITAATPPDRPVFTVTGLNHFMLFAETTFAAIRGDWPDYDFEFIPHMSRDFSSRFLPELAAGLGPDLFLTAAYPLYGFMDRGFFADLYGVMDTVPGVERSDFFTGVLDAMTVNGALYAMPVAFAPVFVGVNAELPGDIVDRFAAQEHISMMGLMELYLDLMDAHPAYSHLTLGYGVNFMPWLAFLENVPDMMDLTQRTASFNNPQTVRFLEDLKRTAGTSELHPPETPRQLITRERMAEKAAHYMFSSFMIESTTAALLELQEPAFAHYIPMTDMNNRPLIYIMGNELISVNPNANNEIALAFIKEYVQERTTFFQPQRMYIPIVRDMFGEQIRNALRNEMTTPGMPPFVGQNNAETEWQLIESAVVRLEALTEQPLSVSPVRFYIPWRRIADVVDAFMAEAHTAEEATEILQSQITQWLNEDRTAVQPVLRPGDSGYPVRVLTVSAARGYGNVIQQAIDSMTAQWRWNWQHLPANERYDIQIDVITYNEGMAGSVDEHYMRMRTMMMAGQGVDMLFMPQFYPLPLRGFARSGMLTDINTLIEADPYTQRSDFHEQVLDAFEIEGGLYAFPLAFGFNYVFINSALPPSIISRFAESPTMSGNDLMAIYLMLMENYSDAFGHLRFASGGSYYFVNHPVIPCNLFTAHAAQFINFNNRTARLTDPGFIDFLNRFQGVYGDFIGSTWITSPKPSADFMRERGGEYVFWITRGMANGIDFYFPALFQAYFTHGRVLTDPAGRHTIRTDSRGTWATISIPIGENAGIAWEFTRHLMDAFTRPEGMADRQAGGGAPGWWGNNSLATPIRRDDFISHKNATFSHLFSHMLTIPGFFREEDIPPAHEIQAAITRIAALNEHPPAPALPLIPQSLFRDNLEMFMLGAMTATEFAHMMQNSVSLWLIE